MLKVPEKDMVTVVGDREFVEMPVLLASLPIAFVRKVLAVSPDPLSV